MYIYILCLYIYVYLYITCTYRYIEQLRQNFDYQDATRPQILGLPTKHMVTPRAHQRVHRVAGEAHGIFRDDLDSASLETSAKVYEAAGLLVN